jgi:hypothetical protein
MTLILRDFSNAPNAPFLFESSNIVDLVFGDSAQNVHGEYDILISSDVSLYMESLVL